MRKFGDEAEMLLAHLRVSLIEIVDLDLSQDELKHTIVEYLAELSKAGPAYVEAKLDERLPSANDDDDYFEPLPFVRARAAQNAECCPTAVDPDDDRLPNLTRFTRLTDGNRRAARATPTASAPNRIGTSRDGLLASAIVEEDEMHTPPRQFRQSCATHEQRWKGDCVGRSLLPGEPAQKASAAPSEIENVCDDSYSLQQIRDYVLQYEHYIRQRYTDWNRSESNSNWCAAVDRLSSPLSNDQLSSCSPRQLEKFSREELGERNANDDDDKSNLSGACKSDGDLDENNSESQTNRFDEFMSQSSANTMANSAKLSISEEELLREMLTINWANDENAN